MATATAPNITSRSPTKLIFFVLFFATTIVAVYDKDARVFDPTSPIAQHFAPALWYLVVHGCFGVVAMAVAAFQFSNRLRARYLRIHRLIGYVYVSSAFIAAPFAVEVAMKLGSSFSRLTANFMNSFGWLVTTAIALYCIRSGNVIQHRRWMIRSYPFAMTFTFNRAIHIFVPMTRLGHPGFEATLWLSCVLAAFLPTIYLDWPKTSRPVASTATAPVRVTSAPAAVVPTDGAG